MITVKQLGILGLFAKDTFREYTFGELKKASGERSNSLFQNALNRFRKEGLIKERKVGNVRLYRIDHGSPHVHGYLELYFLDIIPSAVKTTIRLVWDALDREVLFYSIIIFGSYADGTNKKGSDLDIAVLVPEGLGKSAEAALKKASNRTIIEIDPHVITEKEFQEMLKADYANLGKEIARKNLPVFNARAFYRSMNRAMTHGFNPLPGEGRERA